MCSLFNHLRHQIQAGLGLRCDTLVLLAQVRFGDHIGAQSLGRLQRVRQWFNARGIGSIQLLNEGKDIGSSVNLATSVKGLTVYDEKGTLVSKGPAVDVDFSVGAFGGIDERKVSVGDSAVDVFGVLFK